MFTSRKDETPLNSAAQETNAAAVVTLNAGASNHKNHLSRVIFSYSAAPTGGRLTIAVDGATVGTWAVTGAGPGVIGVNIRAAKPITVTLAAGGSGIVGDVYCEYFDR
jgi:hypothetical protein